MGIIIMNKSVLIALLGLSSVEGMRINQRSTEESQCPGSGSSASANSSNSTALGQNESNASNATSFAQNDSNASNATALAHNDTANASNSTLVGESMDLIRSLVEVSAKQD